MHGYRPEVLVGPEANTRLAGSGADVVLNGITGSIGLQPTLAALEAGSTLALANKESLIVGGAAGQGGRRARARSCRWTPSTRAIAQCLRGGHRRGGAPARPHRQRRALPRPDPGGPGATSPGTEALAHPTWDMGPVITTNSATLVNKGLEVIEAHLLFDIPFDRIDVVVHPQSVVHSMVEFVDGSTIAQASPPDMRLPIALGPRLAGPGAGRRPGVRLDHGLDLGVRAAGRRRLPRRRPWRGEVGEAGATYPAVFNAANEECVDGVPRRPASGSSGIVDTVASGRRRASRRGPRTIPAS